MSEQDRIHDGGPPGLWSTDSLFDHFTTRQRDVESSVMARFEDLQSQLDRRIQTQERERSDVERFLTAAVEGLRREVEVIVSEGQRATEMAEREREKAAAALTNERQNAATTAEREREKAAQALATQLAGQIQQGDAALKDHIEQQIQQLRNLMDSTRREIDIRSEEQQKAISKAEVSYDKRFDVANGVKDQLSDLIAAHQKSLSDITTSLMPREVAESRFNEVAKVLDQAKDERAKALPRETFDRTVAEWTEWKQQVNSQLVGVAILKKEEDKSDVKMTGWHLAFAGFAVTLFVTIVVIAAGLLTSS